MSKREDKEVLDDYFGVNYDIVWVIVKEELPKVLKQIESKQG